MTTSPDRPEDRSVQDVARQAVRNRAGPDSRGELLTYVFDQGLPRYAEA